MIRWGRRVPRTLRDRLLGLLALAVSAVILSAVLSQMSFLRFSAFTDSALSRQVPVITRAYEFEATAIRLSLIANKLLTSTSAEELRQRAQQARSHLYDLDDITAELSAEGEFTEILELNKLSQSLDQEIKLLVAFETKLHALSDLDLQSFERSPRLVQTREEFERHVAEVADLAQRYRAKAERTLKDNVAAFSTVQKRYSWINTLLPFPVALVLLLTGWGMMRGFSRRSGQLHDVLLGKRSSLGTAFFKPNDELSDLGVVALEFTKQKSLLEIARTEQQNLATNLQNLIESANSPIFAFDAKGKITMWNKCVADLTQIEGPADDNDLFLEDVICPTTYTEFVDQVEKARNGETVANVEHCLRHVENRPIPILFNLTRHLTSSGEANVTVCIAQDLTIRNALQAEAVQASKLATLGEMSTGLAHELNQPLNAMRLTLTTLNRGLRAEEIDRAKVGRQIERIDQQITRAADTINHMRVFGRRADEPPTRVDLATCVKHAVDLSSQQMRLAKIQLNIDVESPLDVLGHGVLVEQVILNLLSNAKFELVSREIEDPTIHITGRASGDHNEIIVTDNAGGIPDNVLARIFEPFYSTKEAGEGTGLGLSISYGIIEDMGGSLRAENTDTGAKFVISVPVATSEAVQAAAEDALGNEQVRDGSRRLSVVES